MKKGLLVLILFTSYFCNAQNYQCLQSGVKHYFTNGNGYLRGIRIDSVKTEGDTIVYYPYHTPRGVCSPYYNSRLDSIGGSWLGKRVLQLNNGTFIFDDEWNDSVIIHSQANAGDNWIFYKDTSSLYYMATVVSIDTMSILGVLDTVKAISVNAYNGGIIVTSDPVNGFQILLSKNHGFIQVFDLYTFPYHSPDAIYAIGLDYYLDNCIHSGPWYPTPINIPYTSQPNQTNSIFNIVSLINPTKQQLYNWNVGDVYEYTECYPYIQLGNSNCDPPMAYVLDTIKIKNTTAFNTQYSYTGLISTLTNPVGSGSSGAPTPVYSTALNSGMLTYDTSVLVDTSKMPEEYKQIKIYYYLPNDTSYSMNSPLYASIGNLLDSVDYAAPFEFSTPIIVNKMNLGLVHYNQSGQDVGFYVTDTTLIFSYRMGQTSGNYNPLSLSIKNIKNESPVSFFPNPTSTSLTVMVSSTEPQPITNITITNLVGQTVFTNRYNTEKVQIDVSKLPAGIYFVKVNGTEVRKFVKE